MMFIFFSVSLGAGLQGARIQRYIIPVTKLCQGKPLLLNLHWELPALFLQAFLSNLPLFILHILSWLNLLVHLHEYICLSLFIRLQSSLDLETCQIYRNKTRSPLKKWKRYAREVIAVSFLPWRDSVSSPVCLWSSSIRCKQQTDRHTHSRARTHTHAHARTHARTRTHTRTHARTHAHARTKEGKKRRKTNKPTFEELYQS